MSEYYAIHPQNNYLSHYGVKGMRWGIRRYLNNDGSLSKHANARYGKNPSKKSSALRMQFDFNNLEQANANINADRVEAANRIDYYTNKGNKRTAKYLKKNPALSKKEARQLGAAKYDARIAKDRKAIKEAGKNISTIKQLQNNIIKTAKRNKYSVDSKPATIYGLSTNDRRNAVLFGSMPYAIAASVIDKSRHYSGTSAKFKKKRRG